MPTVLIADDDPVSLRFLQTALESLGCKAVTSANGALALASVDSNTVDLLLLDLQMPDFGGSDLLRALQERGMLVPAIATSAELDSATDAALRRAGFVDTLLKPASLEAIEGLLRRYLVLPARTRASPATVSESPPALPLLDDSSALTAIGGDPDAMRALRGLFAQEIEALERDLNAIAAAEPSALSERLHRLRASSGFCGAAALGSAALHLQQALRSDAARVPDAIADFTQTCNATRRALAERR